MNLLKSTSKKSIVTIDDHFDHATIKYEIQLLDSIDNINLSLLQKDIFNFLIINIRGIINFYWHQVVFQPNLLIIIKVGFFDYSKSYPPFEFYFNELGERQKAELNLYPCESISDISDIEKNEILMLRAIEQKVLDYYDKSFKVSVVKYYDSRSEEWLMQSTIDVLLNKNESLSRGLLGYLSFSKQEFHGCNIIRTYYFDDWKTAEKMYYRLEKYSHRLSNSIINANRCEYDVNSDVEERVGYDSSDPYYDLLDGQMDAMWNID